MKCLAILLAGSLAACVSQSDASPTESTTDDLTAVAVPASTAPEPTTSVWWDQKKGLDDLWPNDQGITSAQVLYRKAADSSSGPTFVAFVVWNANHVGRIFRVHVGADGGSFHDAVQAMIGQRVFGHDGNDSSSGGTTTSGSGKPTPHPNVDGPITYSVDYLNNVRNNAAVIHAAYVNFENFDPVGVPAAAAE